MDAALYAARPPPALATSPAGRMAVPHPSARPVQSGWRLLHPAPLPLALHPLPAPQERPPSTDGWPPCPRVRQARRGD
eukprot:15472401-Alexandrium_andersonii.AAC.1